MVEGWGTLILPSQSYEVLKVKMIVNATDSVYIEAIETGFPIVQPEETIYQWLALDEGVPLLQISQQVGFGYTVRYRFDDAVALEEIEDIDFTIYPNPSSERLTVKSQDHQVTRYSILNAHGNLYANESVPNAVSDLEIPIQDMASGTYLLLLEVEGRTYYSTFFKE